MNKKNVKDLDSWIGKSVKAILNDEGSFYIGILLEEQKNGILVKTDKGRVYIPYESILSLEELLIFEKDRVW
jgi:sporulation protein YlmC with PRC-barrel domain